MSGVQRSYMIFHITGLSFIELTVTQVCLTQIPYSYKCITWLQINIIQERKLITYMTKKISEEKDIVLIQICIANPWHGTWHKAGN